MTPAVYRAERIAAALAAALALCAMALAAWRGVEIDYASFAPHYAAALALLAGAAVYRRSGRAPGIALTLAACALFILFANGGAALNYLLIRPGSVTIDPLLLRLDAALGFDWARFAGWIAEAGPAAPALGWVYRSSLAQLVLVIVVLGFTRRQVALHRFLLAGILCSCACLAIWAVFPSFGPSPFVPLDPQTEAKLGRVVDPGYAGQLLALLRDGPPVIDAERLIGLIAFPSMHTVMAAMAVWYTRRTPVFWPLAAINLLMLPAILVHGGHHLVDVIAGTILFGVVAVLVARIVVEEAAAVSVEPVTDAGRAAPAPA